MVSPHRKTVRRRAKSRKESSFGRATQVVLVAVLMLTTAAYANANLILNPGFEASTNGITPDNWSTGLFGANDAAFSYVDDATGKAGKVTVTAHTDGDAKWYFDDVAVNPSTQYSFTDTYKSTAVTKVTLRFTMQDDSVVYLDLADTLPASPTWKTYTKSFTTPASVKSVTGFHILSAVGELTVDNFALDQVAPVVITDFVPNSSIEQALPTDATVPVSWNREGFGSNTPTFEYVDEGHDGTHSLRLTMADYVSGDAKWAFDAQPLPADKDYVFQAWYKANVSPRVVARFMSTTGTASYQDLRSPEELDGHWHQYTSDFYVPAGTSSVTVYFYMSRNGWVQTDDYHIYADTVTGFDQPIVSLTFDDGPVANFSNALPVLNAYGFKSTQCIDTDGLEGNAANESHLQAYVDSGHEICGHTVSHSFLTQLPAGTALNPQPGTVQYELAHSQDYLKSQSGQSVKNFASPYGEYNSSVLDQVKSLYSSHRTINEGYNTKDNLDLYRLNVQNMRSDTTLAEFQGWVNKAVNDKTWLIIVYHGVYTANPGEFGVLKSEFEAQMAWLANQGVMVRTLEAAIAQISDLPEPVTVEAPVANPTSGSYVSSVSVALSSVGSTSVYYTVEGSAPVCGASTLYSGAITLTSNSSLKAIGCNGTASSAVSTYSYTITQPTQASGGGRGGSKRGPKIGVITGIVYSDANSNGTMDGSEKGVSGQVVYLDLDNNGTKDMNDPTATTSADGAYRFDGLAMDNYHVRVSLSENQKLVIPGSNKKGAYKVKLSTKATMSVGQDFAVNGGTVLGTEIEACKPLITQNLYIGIRNDEVRRLQEFLAKHLGRAIPITGYYGPITKAGVSVFQMKYRGETLAPLALVQPTGNVYALTRNQINKINCAK